MLLKIFVKRKAHGELCNVMIPDDVENQTVVEEFHEASEIRKSEIKEGFLFKMNGMDGESWTASCLTVVMGYELQNERGLVVDRYVTAIDEEAIKAYYSKYVKN